MFGETGEARLQDDDGCAFIQRESAVLLADRCGAPCRPGSAYCPDHHALCHLAGGSAAEARQLRAIEALAAAVGGRQGRIAREPPAGLLRRLARIEEAFLRAECSWIVLKNEDSYASQRQESEPE